MKILFQILKIIVTKVKLTGYVKGIEWAIVKRNMSNKKPLTYKKEILLKFKTNW